MQVHVEGIGLCGPGLKGWAASRAVLGGAAPYAPAPIAVPPCELLPATERRRTVASVKLALAVGGEALAHAERDPAATATVFASSGGDGETVHEIVAVLASPEREVSPTRFHNSVHNAPAGYWHIATRSREPSTSLCCYDASFSAGLLEAAVQATVGDRAVALIAYDLPYPEPMHTARTIGSFFSLALVLTPHATGRSLARLAIELRRDGAGQAVMSEPALETLRLHNPAARSLPLLAALARDAAATIVWPDLPRQGLAVAALPAETPRR